MDVTALTAIDEGGRELLGRWREAGAEFLTDTESAALLGGVVPFERVAVSRAARSTLQSALFWLAGLLMLGFAVALHAAETIPAPDPVAASNLALSKYFASLQSSQSWGEETVEIEASLPKLKEHGRLSAIRRLLPLGKPQYQVFEQDGSRTVRQQVIARYLSAEVESASMAPSAVSVSPANYRFQYEGTVVTDGGTEYVFQITPKKKRTGMIQGMLWIDAETGSALRLSGYLVKKPSIFIKRVDLTRETNLRDGVAESRVTHLALDTRLVGRAELTIHERPCTNCSGAPAESSGAN